MFKNLLGLAFVLGMFFTVTSCSEDCQTCVVTTESAGIPISLPEQEFCDDELDAVKASAGTATTAGIEVITTVDCN